MRALTDIFKGLTPAKLKKAPVATQKKVFLALMEEGWKDKGWVNGIRHHSDTVCALGAAEVAAERRFGSGYYYNIEDLLPALRNRSKSWGESINSLIATASNYAGSKAEAIKAVKAIRWMAR